MSDEKCGSELILNAAPQVAQAPWLWVRLGSIIESVDRIGVDDCDVIGHCGG